MTESRQPIANLGDYLQRGAANEIGLPGRSSKRYLKTMINLKTAVEVQPVWVGEG
jgi:hypothetical protein